MMRGFILMGIVFCKGLIMTIALIMMISVSRAACGFGSDMLLNAKAISGRALMMVRGQSDGGKKLTGRDG